MNATRVFMIVLVALVAATLVAPPAPARTAQNLPGSTWRAPATVKASVSADGEKESVEGPATVTFEFGPQAGLLGNEFRMTIDDGQESLVFGGLYELNEKGKPKLTMNEQVAASQFLLLWDRVVDEFFPGIKLPVPTTEVDKAKMKAKPKEKSSGEIFKLKMKSKWFLEFFLPQHVRVKMKLSIKAKNGVRVI